MWVILFVVAAVGATSPTKSKCLMPTGPYVEPKCGLHASFVMCPPNCPATQNCSTLWSKFPCEDDGCCYPACRCDDGYLRDDQTGQCVTIQECMNKPNRSCTTNETRVPCPITCPPQACDAGYVSYLCAQKDDSVPCEPGCNCKDGYLRDAQGICILQEECPSPPWFKKSPVPQKTTPKPVNPIRCGPNEERKECKTICPPQKCEIAYTDYACNKTYPCEAGCDCIKDHLRDANGVCVPSDECPPPPTIKPPVEENKPPAKPSKCSSTVHSKSSSYSSSKSSNCSSASTNTSTTHKGKTKPKPPKCGVNEKWVPCKTICPPQSCAISYTTYLCEPPPPCEPGCDCIQNYLRDDSGVCISNEKCPPPPVVTESPVTEPPGICPPENPCGANETEVNCKVECPDSYCPVNDNRGILLCDLPYPCPSGCACRLGYRRKSYEDRSCILAEECSPVPCTRKNEEWNPCPGCLAEDCTDVNNQPSVCNELVHNCYPKCVCKKGFYRNGTDDCVPASECPPPVEVTTLPPESNQCGINETYVRCTFGCPTNNCPTSDTRAIVACSPPYPCKPGCACKISYRRKSYEDRSCILAEECPPVNCTRPHEKWNPCPSPCLSERCGDQDNPPVTCNELIKDCRPKCVCEDGYYRDDNDICVPAKECPTKECPANQTYVSCNVRCPTENCPVSDNRFMVACAIAYPCPAGCACKQGYRTESYDVDNCILAEDCPPVNCTRKNESWNRCPSSCRREYCQDVNNPRVPCDEVRNCNPKCECNPGFYRNSTDDCVPLEECPPACTNSNEEWNTCPSPCLAEYCLDSNNPKTPCNESTYKCEPRCVCKPGFFRDDTGSCVPFSECGKGLCNANETYAYCKAGCPYDYCPVDDSNAIIACDPPYPCPKGCICKLNYKRRSYEDPTCIRTEECAPVPCNRPNEKWDPCTSSCLAESCTDYLNPPGVCNEFVQNCEPKCVCEKGFYRNDSQICVPAKECGAKQCGLNETYSECTFGCPHDFCPENDDQVIYACKPPRDCPPGCRCKFNYRWKSYDDRTCVLASDCPPVNCTTRPHEKWTPCPSPCLRESCEDVNNQPKTCNYLVHNCQPRCTCEKGYFRNEDRICIHASKCPKKIHQVEDPVIAAEE